MKITGLRGLPNRTIRAKSVIDELDIVTPPRIIDGGVIESKTIPTKLNLINSIRQTIGLDGEIIKSNVANLENNGYIRIDGEYATNFVDFRTIDISKIKVVDGTKFRFLLSIKETINDANPTLYTSKQFYDDLVYSYSEDNPYEVAAATKQEAIVVIVLDSLVQKVESLHSKELDETADNGVLVTKNLFVLANFDLDGEADVTEYKDAIANSTYNVNDVVKYIDWVVSKPNANYEDRLLTARSIGRWKFDTFGGDFVDSIVPKEDELPNDLKNPTSFPPFGKPGDWQNQIDTDDIGNDWKWDINTQQWKQEPTSDLPSSAPLTNNNTQPNNNTTATTNTTPPNENNTGGGGISGDS